MLMYMFFITSPIYIEDNARLCTFCCPLYFSKRNFKMLNAEIRNLLFKTTMKNLHYLVLIFFKPKNIEV